MRRYAGIAMEYLEKWQEYEHIGGVRGIDEGKFLGDWEVIHAADNYKLATEYIDDIIIERLKELHEKKEELLQLKGNDKIFQEDVEKRFKEVLTYYAKKKTTEKDKEKKNDWKMNIAKLEREIEEELNNPEGWELNESEITEQGDYIKEFRIL